MRLNSISFCQILLLLIFMISCSDKEDSSQVRKENLKMNKKIETCDYLPESAIKDAFPEAEAVKIQFLDKKYPRCKCEFKLNGMQYSGKLILRMGKQDENKLDLNANKFGNSNIRKKEPELGEKAYYFGGKYGIYMVLKDEHIVNFQLQEMDDSESGGTSETIGSNQKISFPIMKAILAELDKAKASNAY